MRKWVKEMRKNCQVYVSNPGDVLRYESEAYYSVELKDEVSKYLTNEAGYLHLGQVTIDLPDLPHREALTVLTVAAMREALAKHRAKAESEAKMMEQQINDLLMIGHSVRED